MLVSGLHTVDKEGSNNLLLHLLNLELMTAELGPVDIVSLVTILRGNDALDLPNERFAGIGDSLRRTLQPLLRFGHEVRLNAGCGDQLRRRGSHFVRCDDHLLKFVASTDNTIGSFDQHIRGRGNSLGSGDETFSPPVVAFVEGGARASSFALRHNLLLRYRCGLDKLSNSIGDGDRGLQNRPIVAILIPTNKQEEMLLTRESSTRTSNIHPSTYSEAAPDELRQPR